MTLSVNHKVIARFHLADTWRWQDFHFEDIMLNQGDLIELTIDEIYPGKTSQQPGITEIVEVYGELLWGSRLCHSRGISGLSKAPVLP